MSPLPSKSLIKSHEPITSPSEIAANGNFHHPSDATDRLHRPCLWIRKGYQRFLQPPEIEGRLMARHSVLEAFHVPVYVPVQQRQEQAEIRRITLMR